ncbi:MAG TPA: class I SAM-dependent methyltransferase [Rhizomicrobium sp.]|jgi:SAM-dependent methyltransferase|nr:class I SAM-dependent methyltransferase [Rhizomicrobium sp.]
MNNLCELCRCDALEQVYTPERSTRGMTIHLCHHCGLVQSLPRHDRAARAPAAVSGGADWGNVRYGKGFRTKAVLDALTHHADLSGEISLLDVGSNRGSFARAFLEAAPNARLVAVEPDERVAGSCNGLDRTKLICARIEDAALDAEHFDIIHSCHTIEHVAEPAHVLTDHWRTLKPGGLLVLDAPNLAFLGGDDVVEEWFIDKHLTHFSARTLTRMIEAAGFTIVQQPDAKDRDNLLFVARKTGEPHLLCRSDTVEVEHAETLLAHYIVTRARNLLALTVAAAEINKMKSRGVVMWGAGRIFDSLVMHGHFDPHTLTLLIDKHLKPHVSERYGCAVSGPEALAGANAEIVIIMSRSFAKEITDEVRRLAPKVEIILYTDLLAQARTKMAA